MEIIEDKLIYLVDLSKYQLFRRCLLEDNSILWTNTKYEPLNFEKNSEYLNQKLLEEKYQEQLKLNK